MSVHYDRAALLLRQHRPEQAEAELRQALQEDPNHAQAHGLLALCLADREQYADAAHEAEAAVGLSPDDPFCHYAMACVLARRNRFREAETVVQRAIELDPWNSSYFALLAQVRSRQKQWRAALEAAEQGLDCDPEDADCTNQRVTALLGLGRKAEAEAAVQGTLARDPENSDSHAALGWTLLEKRQYPAALEHFREALRLEPDSAWARSGLVAALKAHYPIYGLMLRYFLWMSKLSPQVQFGVILGGYFGVRFLQGLLTTHPEFAIWIWPLIIVYCLFAYLTWLADPLFNLLLRMNRFGRYALSREETFASNWFGGCLVCAVTFIVCAFVFDVFGLFLLGAAAAFLLLPMAGAFSCPRGWPRIAMTGYTVLLALVGIAAAVSTAVAPEATDGLITTYMFGILGSGFLANGLMMVQPKL